MSGKPLAIFDLDDTLVRGDSFRMLIMEQLPRRPRLLLHAGLRALRLTDRARFAEAAHRALLPLLRDSAFIEEMVGRLRERVQEPVLERVHERRRRGEMVVLISASPNEYVAPFARAMGFDAGHGSGWRNGHYVHLHGAGKLRHARDVYPPSHYEWRYAISDSESDLPLLRTCREYELWT